MGAAVVHFEVNVRDTKRACEFYKTLFDWTIDANNPIQYGMVKTGLTMGIGGGIAEPPTGAAPCATFYVQVENVKAYLDRAVRLGGKVVVPATVIPDMVTFGMFADPEGNVIGMVQGPQTDPPKMRKRASATSSRKRSSPKQRRRR